MSDIMYIDDIKNHLPHRYPFLLVDRVTDFVENKSIAAIKNVTINEPFFNGHFPQKSVMPGVLQIEALAQASGILMMKSLNVTTEEGLFFLAGVDKARFKKMVIPGDQLLMTVEVLRARKSLWKFKGQITVDGEIACEAEFMNARGS